MDGFAWYSRCIYAECQKIQRRHTGVNCCLASCNNNILQPEENQSDCYKLPHCGKLKLLFLVLLFGWCGWWCCAAISFCFVDRVPWFWLVCVVVGDYVVPKDLYPYYERWTFCAMIILWVHKTRQRVARVLKVDTSWTQNEGT